MSYDVFISYSRKDTKIANRILSALEAAGYHCFIDRVGISGGADFPAVICDAIMNSKLTLLLASENSYKSEYTQKELVFTVNNKGSQFIFPLIIDGSSLPKNLEFMLSNINWRTLSDDYRIEPELIEDIRQRLEHPESFLGVIRKKGTPTLPKSVLKAGAIALAVLLVSGLGVILYKQNAQRVLSRQADRGRDVFLSMLDSAQTMFSLADSLRDLGQPELLFAEEVEALFAGERFLQRADSVKSVLDGNPYIDLPIDRYTQLSRIPAAKRDSLFAVWKPYSLENWYTWQRTSSPFEKMIATQSVSNALLLNPDDQELQAIYKELSL